jgi:hypothetical protein
MMDCHPSSSTVALHHDQVIYDLLWGVRWSHFGDILAVSNQEYWQKHLEAMME